MRLRIVRKRGLPFFLRRRRARFGLAIGALLCAALPILLSQCIWVIDVADPDAWTRECVRQTLSDVGIREGMHKSGLQASFAERELLLRLPQAEWIALNVNGSVLHVELRHAQELPEQADYTRPCHIVAAKDGFLTRLEAYEGTEEATLRTAVQKGQLLVSGAVEHSDGSVTFRHAKGYAEAQTTQKLCAQSEPDRLYRTVGAVRTRTDLEIFSVHFLPTNRRAAENTLWFSYTETFTARALPLPIRCTFCRELSFGAPRKLSSKQNKLLLLSDFGQQAAVSLRACSVLKADIRVSESRCVGTFRLLENIGTEQEILTESDPS